MDTGTPTCPTCNSDFVEEVEDEDLGNNLPNFNPSNIEFEGVQADLAATMMNMFQQFLENDSNNQNRTGEFRHQTGNVGNGVFFYSSGPQTQRSTTSNTTSFDDSPFRTESANNSTDEQTNNDSNTNPLSADPMLRGIAQLLRQHMGGAEGTMNPLAALFGATGNLGDYAMGPRGFDDIITSLMEQANAANAPPPATEEQIVALPQFPIVKTENNKDCTICQEEYSDNEVVSEMPCKHVFHPSCIEYWLKINGTCPVCRFSLVKKSENNENGDSTPPERGTAQSMFI
ncbi:hypothetical protein HDU92_004861 [Lobulomyces angularis]|nr:hypothetical protein HDU92_004861 [Lobulomyces angularis]